MKKRKIINIELIRIIAMLMIITLHCNLFGIKIVNSGDNKYIIFIVLEYVCIIGVNLYVIITGFFLNEFKFKLKKILYLQLIVIFYSIILYFYLVFFHHLQFNTLSFFKNFFPILTGKYWFYTCYVILYFFLPFIKKIYQVLKNNNKVHCFIILLIIVTSVLPSIYPVNSLLMLNDGYSYVWFISLVFIAAYLRDNKIQIKTKNIVTLYTLILIFQCLLYYKCDSISFFPFMQNFKNNGLSYNNILVFINSILAFEIMNRIKIKSIYIEKKILSISKVTFSIYLIHMYPDFINVYWDFFANLLGKFQSIKFFIVYFLIIIFIFVSCTIIDKVRFYVFKIIHRMIPQKMGKFLNSKFICIDEIFN